MKNLVSQQHIIFSTENSPYPDKVRSNISHDEAIKQLNSMGSGKAFSVMGHYGAPEKSIFLSNPDEAQEQYARELSHKLGQESHVESTGKNHRILFNHGPRAGTSEQLGDTVWHKTPPEDNFTTLPDGSMFSHPALEKPLGKSESSKHTTLPANQILASHKSVERSHFANKAGKGSRSKGPLHVHKLEDGRHLLVDGYHRFAQGIAEGKKSFPVKVVSEGYSDYHATPSKDDEFKGWAKKDLGKSELKKAPIAYHGSTVPFEEHKKPKMNDPKHSLNYGPGIYYATDPEEASEYANVQLHRLTSHNKALDEARKNPQYKTDYYAMAAKHGLQNTADTRHPNWEKFRDEADKYDAAVVSKKLGLAPNVRRSDVQLKNAFDPHNKKHALKVFQALGLKPKSQAIAQGRDTNFYHDLVNHDQITGDATFSHRSNKLNRILKRIGFDGIHDKIFGHIVAFDPKSIKPATGILQPKKLAASELQKGAMRRLAPFNPTKVPKKERSATEDWVSGVSSSSTPDSVPKAPKEALMRGLHKLSSLTQVRKNPQTGEREFLLHRGMRPTQSDHFIHHGSPGEVSSWTPDKATARDFASAYSRDQSKDELDNYAREYGRTPDTSKSHVHSAWVPESKIRHIPNTIGAVSMRSSGPKFGLPSSPIHPREKEVLVEPHKFNTVVMDPKTMAEYGPEADIDARIAERGRTKDSDFHKPNDLKSIIEHVRAGQLPLRPTSNPKKLASSELAKMSRPRITFPGLPKVTTRPDQEVQTIATPKQAQMFGRKTTVDIRDKDVGSRPVSSWAALGAETALNRPVSRQAERTKEAKRVTGKFSRRTLGMNSPSKHGPVSGALVGKMRSKWEDADESHAPKMAEHGEKRNAAIADYNKKTLDWRARGNDLAIKINEPGNREKWEQHLVDRPQKPKLPRAPSKKKLDTTELTTEQAIARGRAESSTIEHEGLHHIMDRISQHYGPAAAKAAEKKLLEQFDPSTLSAVGGHIAMNLGYKLGSPNFMEEILAHSRDILVNPKKREEFKAYTKDKADQHIKNLKIGHQKAYAVAQKLKPSDLGIASEEAPTKLAASEHTKKRKFGFVSIEAENPPMLEEPVAEPLSKTASPKPGKIWAHGGYHFMETPHPKTPAGHKAYDIRHKETGSKELIFAKSPEEVGQFINKLNQKSKLNKSEGNDREYSADEVVSHFKRHDTPGDHQARCESYIRKFPKYGLSSIDPDETNHNYIDATGGESKKMIHDYSKKTTEPPAIVVHHDPGEEHSYEKYRIIDGLHRTKAAIKQGKKSIKAFIPIKQINKSETLQKGPVRSPRKGHTIAQLERLKDSNWHNPDTGTEISEGEGEEHLHQLRQNKADKKTEQMVREQTSPKTKKPSDNPGDWFGKAQPNPGAPAVKINPEHGKIIADAYGKMKHEPNHPAVKAAYGALIGETSKQFKDLLAGGLKISKIKPGQENPYKTSKDLHADVINNNHVWYFPTEQGFGSEGEAPKDHPMMQPTNFNHDGKSMLANDVFRVVHDIFGHHKGGQTGFGPKGEHQAFLTHKKMYSPLAQKALASETMGQNSYVTAGPNAEHNKKNPSKTIYADQKAGLLPDSILNREWHNES